MTDDKVRGYLLLLLIFFCLSLFKSGVNSHSPETDVPCPKVFVQIQGDVRTPGVYGFSRSPLLEDLLRRTGGFSIRPQVTPEFPSVALQSGKKVGVRIETGKAHFTLGEMSAFQKVTLRIPVSLNRETTEGLTAIPGIGPKIAEAIVRERSKRGGFRTVDEIETVQGIGSSLYEKVKPYLGL